MSKAIVILSGGQDSTTVAAIARRDHDEVHAITFNYGQRHAIEIESAVNVATLLKLHSSEVVSLGPILTGSSPLVSNEPLGVYDAVESLPGGIEPTFVPARNILFLTIAANRAVLRGADTIYAGLCEEDYGGYPDCRSAFVESLEQSLNLGLYGRTTGIRLRNPLMSKTKAQSVLIAKSLLQGEFEHIMGVTHTCYAGIKGGCGKCHACHLRDRGFRDAGIPDPLWKLREVSQYA